MARRAAGALIAAATLLFVIVSFWGTANQGSVVRYESTYRGAFPVYTMTAVTALGKRAGLRPGDVLDFRRLTPYERYAFDLWETGPISTLENVGNGAALGFVAADESFTIPYLRNGHVVDILRRTEPAPWNDHVAAVLTDVFSGFCAVFGALLLIRGRDRSSLLGGAFLLVMSIGGLDFMYGFDGFFAMPGLAVPTEIMTDIAISVAMILLYFFAESFLPPQAPPASRWIFRTLYVPVVIFNVLSTIQVVWYIFIGNFDTEYVAGEQFALAYLLGMASVLGLLWYSSIERHQTQRVSVRIIFWSLLLSFTGIVVNVVVEGLLGREWPLDGLLGLTLLIMPIGTAYVVFTKNLYDVDFFVSRAALYAILLAIVVAAIAVTESFLDHVALGRFGNIAVSFAVPIVLGLSMRWIGGRVEIFLQSTLYRDKMAAHERLRALADDFAEAHDPDALARQVVLEIHKTFRSPCAVYRIDGTRYVPYVAEGFEHALPPVTQDDPAFMRLRRCRDTVDLRAFETALPRHGLLFPLSVVGRVYGAVLVGARPHDQWYDPDDQSVIRGVAAELAAALLWLRDKTLTATTNVLTAKL
jgi:hypothetical protein